MNYSSYIHNGIEFTKVNHDGNGNPRYVVHFLSFITDKDSQEYHKKYGLDAISNLYKLALNRSRKIGGSKYRGKWFGGGIVFQSFNIKKTSEQILKIK